MKININLQEKLAFVLVIVVLAITPLLIWGIEKVIIPATYGDAKIINLTGVAATGIWTDEDVAAYNYWTGRIEKLHAEKENHIHKEEILAEEVEHKEVPEGHFRVAREILVPPGERVVLRLKSADVLHSFAIPKLRLGPIEVDAGHTAVMEFTAPEEEISLRFLCWQYCSPHHHNMRGSILVSEEM